MAFPLAQAMSAFAAQVYLAGLPHLMEYLKLLKVAPSLRRHPGAEAPGAAEADAERFAELGFIFDLFHTAPRDYLRESEDSSEAKGVKGSMIREITQLRRQPQEANPMISSSKSHHSWHHLEAHPTPIHVPPSLQHAPRPNHLLSQRAKLAREGKCTQAASSRGARSQTKLRVFAGRKLSPAKARVEKQRAKNSEHAVGIALPALPF